jgi:peptide/nickel transport system substrate-binding protein
VAAVAGLAVVTAACSSSSGGSGSTLSGISGAGMYGSLPAAASGAQHTGMIKVGLEGSPPEYILPVTPAADGNIYNDFYFQQQMWRPLYWTTVGDKIAVNSSMSMADAPKWSNGDKTASITIKPNYKWSDGQPVTSKDVEFAFDEIAAAIKESPANWSAYSQGLSIPDDVASVSTPSASTVVFNFKHTTNPSWFEEDELSGGGLTPLPSHAWAKDSANGPTLDFTNPANAKKIYDFLNTQAKSLGTWTTNPLWKVVDGPYKLSAFNSTTGNWTMEPNSSYGGPHAKTVSPFQTIYYTTDAAEFEALKTGAVDLGWVPGDDVPDAKSVSAQYNLWGYPAFGWSGAIYNFKDKTGDFDNIISQLYVRQALAHLVDQQGIIKAYLHGAGSGGYGVVSANPASQYTPADAKSDPYPYNPSTAENLLKSHGWSIVPNGTDTCTKPGTAANECGAGIPAGTKLAWNLVYSTTPPVEQEMSTNLASVAKSIGIEISLKGDSFNDVTANENDVSTPSNTNKWAMSDFGGFSDSTYPTTEGLFNTGGSFNMGGYSDPKLDNLVDQSVDGTNPAAVENELSYVTEQQPVMFQPNPDWDGNDPGIMAISKQISGPPDDFANYSQYALTPEFWYFTK